MSAVLAFPTGEMLSRFSVPLQPSLRCYHEKFGLGTIVAVDGNKLTVDFDRAGQKRVLDSFVRSTAGQR
jgi:DNA helicase-2/ATP-dependent DNA helicase PcrA